MRAHCIDAGTEISASATLYMQASSVYYCIDGKIVRDLNLAVWRSSSDCQTQNSVMHGHLWGETTEITESANVITQHLGGLTAQFIDCQSMACLRVCWTMHGELQLRKLTTTVGMQ